MPPCTGYKRACWFATSAKDPTNRFCIACLKASDTDAVTEYLATPAFRTSTSQEILAVFSTPPFTRSQAQTTTGILEKILDAIYKHPLRQELLIRYTNQIAPNSAFQFLAYDHTHSVFCKCYPTLLRATSPTAIHPLSMTLPFPRRCLRCILNCALYAPTPHGFDTLYMSQQFTQICANALEWQPDGFDLLVRFAAETPSQYSSGFIPFVRQVFKRARRPDADYDTWVRAAALHPLLLSTQTTLTRDQYTALKQRIAPFKEELIMRTWAPERLMAWCLDLEDLRDISD